MAVKDRTGEKFGRLTAQWPAGYKYRGVMWLCSCECGGYKVVSGGSLSRGVVRSCGCLVKEQIKRMNDNPIRYKHGHALRGNVSRVYRCWNSMGNRCFNVNNQKYHDYGGRGITVCDRWRGEDGFENFLADMGPKPSGLSLDRIDVNGNYEPFNCRWATASQQQHNRRNSRDRYMVEALGNPSLMADLDGTKWAREFVSTVKTNPSLALDVEAVATWFKAAIKAGYEHDNEATENLLFVLKAANDQIERRIADGTMILIQ